MGNSPQNMSKIFQITANKCVSFFSERWQQYSPRQRRRLKIIFGLLLLGLLGRSLPYFAPIRAEDIEQSDRAIIFTDRHGQALGTILTRNQEHTAVVTLDRISPEFLNAIIAAEDKRYYQHGALDSQAIARAILEAIQAREIVSGASTITMQLARMLHPTLETRFLQETGFLGETGFLKLQDIWLSWRLTAGMSKDEILAAYINRLPMGGNIYGVEAAARNYFGIPAAELNLAQATILASLPNDPTDLNPYYHWEPLKKRQRYVLDRMVADGYISAIAAERAYQERLQLQSGDRGIIAAPHFMFWLADRVPETVSHIRTTIDLSLQKFVEAQVQEIVGALSASNVNHAAAIVLDNQTGEILAYVGSPDYFSDEYLGRNDGVQALRQPGSTLKPFLYQLALEKKVIRPNSILPDVPTYYPIPGAKVYSPIDYNETFQGPVRVRVALGNSLNIPAVRILEKIGVETFLQRLHELGFSHLNQSPEHYGLGLALGSGEVSLWQLARAYLTLANPTRRDTALPCPYPYSPSAVISSDTATYPYSYSPSAVISSDTAMPCPYIPMAASPSDTAMPCPYGIPVSVSPCLRVSVSPSPPLSPSSLITDILSDRHARTAAFGVDSVLNLPFPAAVKTGTSSDFRDTWTVGYTTDYTVATWVGNFSGDRMRKVSGVTGAAPLWNRIMLHLHQNKEPEKFAPPAQMVQRPICAITGLKPTEDCPSVVLEYFAIADLAHYEKDNTFELSSEYNEWLSRQEQPLFGNHDLKIVFPQNDDYLLIDPANPNSKVQFKLASTPTEPVEWELITETGKQKLTTTELSQGIFWPLEVGEWTLEVKSGEKIDRVNFQVVLDEYRETPRGFSLVKDETDETL